MVACSPNPHSRYLGLHTTLILLTLCIHTSATVTNDHCNNTLLGLLHLGIVDDAACCDDSNDYEEGQEEDADGARLDGNGDDHHQGHDHGRTHNHDDDNVVEGVVEHYGFCFFFLRLTPQAP